MPYYSLDDHKSSYNRGPGTSLLWRSRNPKLSFLLVLPGAGCIGPITRRTPMDTRVPVTQLRCASVTNKALRGQTCPPSGSRLLKADQGLFQRQMLRCISERGTLKGFVYVILSLKGPVWTAKGSGTWWF